MSTEQDRAPDTGHDAPRAPHMSSEQDRTPDTMTGEAPA